MTRTLLRNRDGGRCPAPGPGGPAGRQVISFDKPTLTALGMGGPKPAPPPTATGPKPTTPVGPAQSSAERTAEPRARHSAPTGE